MIETIGHVLRIAFGYFLSTGVAAVFVASAVIYSVGGTAADALFIVAGWVMISLALSVPAIGCVGICEYFSIQRWQPYAGAGAVLGGLVTPLVFYGARTISLPHVLSAVAGALLGFGCGYVYWAASGHVAHGSFKSRLAAVALLAVLAISATYLVLHPKWL